MNEPINICLLCGACCDGTLIGFVHLDSEELPVTREVMNIEEQQDVGFFLQPCDKLGCNGCSIYSQRPKQCASFNCQLLNALKRNEKDSDSAIEVINLVKTEKNAIEKQLETLPFKLKSESFYFKMMELKKLLRENKLELPLSKNLQELVSKLKKLDMLISKEFGLPSY